MNLKQMLSEIGLLEYIETECKTLAFMSLESYEKINDGFILHTGKMIYIVQVHKYSSEKNKDSYYYVIKEKQRNGEFKELPRNSKEEEQRLPKLPIWVGRALVAEKAESSKPISN